MNFHNLDKIMDNVNVHNKYLLTAVIAQRARQISEVKGVNGILEKHPGEKAISLALCDMEDGNVSVQLQTETIPDAIENELESEAAFEEEQKNLGRAAEKKSSEAADGRRK